MTGRYAVGELAEACRGRLYGSATEELCISQISTDTRRLGSGHLFLALIGERFDGHDFLAEAVDRGAAALLLSREDLAAIWQKRCPVILVEDSLQALKDLASWYRDKLQGRVIAVTGSVGKTSTRDWIYTALSSLPVSRTEENLNNEIGISQTLLATDCEAAYLVLEIGIDHPGEMASLASMVRPDMAVVTMIGVSHIEHFADREHIAREKLQLAHFLRPGAYLLLNADDPLLRAFPESPAYQNLKKNRAIKVAFVSSAERKPCGLDEYLLLYAEQRSSHSTGISAVCRWSLPLEAEESLAELLKASTEGLPETPFKLNLKAYGGHQLTNALFALVCAALAKVPYAKVREQLSNYQSTGRRMKRLDGKKLTLIDDSYNASPESMRAALLYLRQMGEESGRRTVAALGSINELGLSSASLHREVGRYIAEASPSLVFLCGSHARDMLAGACSATNEPGEPEADKRTIAGDCGKISELFVFPDRDALTKELIPLLEADDILLVKGSHSFEMDKVGAAAWQKMEEAL